MAEVSGLEVEGGSVTVITADWKQHTVDAPIDVLASGDRLYLVKPGSLVPTHSFQALDVERVDLVEISPGRTLGLALGLTHASVLLGAALVLLAVGGRP